MQLKNYVKEITLTIVTFMWLLFVATNVNVMLGQIYLFFAVGSLLLLIITITIFDKRLTISWQKRPGGTFKALLFGFGGWIALLITSILVLKFIDPANANLAAIMGLIGASTPALAASKIANLLTFGFAIAFIETNLWARLLEFFCDLFHIPVNKQSFRKIGFIFIIGLLSLAFLFFHLTAKGITNIGALTVVFIMMLISLIMITIFGETRQAVFMHIWANAIASYLLLFVVGGVGALGL